MSFNKASHCVCGVCEEKGRVRENKTKEREIEQSTRVVTINTDSYLQQRKMGTSS